MLITMAQITLGLASTGVGWRPARHASHLSMMVNGGHVASGEPAPAGGFFDMLNKWNNAFDIFDVDQDGFIPASEIGSVLTECGMSYDKGALAKAVERYDANGNNRIDFDEFMEMMTLSSTEQGGIETQVAAAIAVKEQHEGQHQASEPSPA